MGMLERLAKKILKSLSNKELHQLCEAYDDGSMDDLFLTYLYPVDKKNYPAEYVDLEIEDDDDPDDDLESDPTYLAGYNGEEIP